MRICFATFLLFILLSPFRAEAQTFGRSRGVDPEEQFRVLREQLIENVLIPGGITNQRVLDSVKQTLRHHFVPKAQIAKSYQDI
ncbi:MAG: hypothetical protein ACOVQM_19190, partial [Pirellula sp.]